MSPQYNTDNSATEVGSHSSTEPSGSLPSTVRDSPVRSVYDLIKDDMAACVVDCKDIEMIINGNPLNLQGLPGALVRIKKIPPPKDAWDKARVCLIRGITTHPQTGRWIITVKRGNDTKDYDLRERVLDGKVSRWELKGYISVTLRAPGAESDLGRTMQRQFALTKNSLRSLLTGVRKDPTRNWMNVASGLTGSGLQGSTRSSLGSGAKAVAGSRSVGQDPEQIPPSGSPSSPLRPSLPSGSPQDRSPSSSNDNNSTAVAEPLPQPHQSSGVTIDGGAGHALLQSILDTGRPLSPGYVPEPQPQPLTATTPVRSAAARAAAEAAAAATALQRRRAQQGHMPLQQLQSNQSLVGQSDIYGGVASSDGPDLVEAAETVELIDPITRLPIHMPCRAVGCRHGQVFDRDAFLNYLRQRKQAEIEDLQRSRERQLEAARVAKRQKRTPAERAATRRARDLQKLIEGNMKAPLRDNCPICSRPIRGTQDLVVDPEIKALIEAHGNTAEHPLRLNFNQQTKRWEVHEPGEPSQSQEDIVLLD
eukprot:Clim_evm42s240 gene=Clim_evmTU42s240